MTVKYTHSSEGTESGRLFADLVSVAPGMIGVVIGIVGSLYLFDPQAFGSWRNGVAILVAAFAIIVAQPFLMQYFEMRAVRRSLLERADKLVDDTENLAGRIEAWEKDRRKGDLS